MDNINHNQYTEGLDEIDRYIIEAMRQDGRVPFAQIAKHLKVSPGMIRVRYDRLKELGLIRVVGITNPLRMAGYPISFCNIGGSRASVAKSIAPIRKTMRLAATKFRSKNNTGRRKGRSMVAECTRKQYSATREVIASRTISVA